MLDMINKTRHQLDQLLQEFASQRDQRDDLVFQGNDGHVAFVTPDSESFVEFLCNHLRTDNIEGCRGA